MAKEKYLLALILVLGLALRLLNLDQSFWLDEASQAQLSSASVSQIWSGRGGDFHPPLFYLLAHYWLQLGRSEVWLRLLPVGFGVWGVWAMYWLAKEALGRQNLKIGICASFLVAINPFHIYYSQEFRMYSLVALVAIWSMYLFIKSSRWWWLSLTLMLYTHYASFLLLATILIYVLVFESKKLKFCLLQSTIGLLFYSPWLPQFATQLQAGVNIDQYLPGWRDLLALGPVKALPLVLFKLVAGRINFLSRIVYGVYLAYVLALVGVSVMLAKVRRRFLLSWLFGPLVASIIISFVVPLTQPFRLIFILPALILILTQAVLRFPRLMLLLIVYISITGVVMYQTRPRLQREQWRQAAQYLQSVATADSAVVVKFSGNFAPLEWYAPDLGVLAAVPAYPARAGQVATRLTGLADRSPVYVVDYLGELTDPYAVVEKYLSQEKFTKAQTVNFEGVGFISEYSRAW